jgi:hypothetical protein
MTHRIYRKKELIMSLANLAFDSGISGIVLGGIHLPFAVSTAVHDGLKAAQAFHRGDYDRLLHLLNFCTSGLWTLASSATVLGGALALGGVISANPALAIAGTVISIVGLLFATIVAVFRAKTAFVPIF